MAKHIGAYSSLHGPGGKVLTDYTEANIPQLWDVAIERITNVANDGSQYTGVITGWTTANPFVLKENKFFLFTPHVHNNNAPRLSINGLPLRSILEPHDRSPLAANTLTPVGEYLLWYRDGAFERLLNFRTMVDDIRNTERVIQLLADDQDISAYQGAADLIATGGYNRWDDAGGKFWKRGSNVPPDPSVPFPAFWRRQAFDGHFYTAVTKRTVYGEEIGITGDTNDVSDNYAPAINDVFEWMNLHGGGRLILPPGQIRCNSAIRIRADGVMLEGTAAGLTSTGGTTLLMGNNASISVGGNVAIGELRNYQVHFNDLGLQQEEGSSAFLINSQAVTGLHFSDIHLRGIYGFHSAGNTSPLAGATPNSTTAFTYRNITGNFSVTASSHFLRGLNIGNFTMTNVGIDGPNPVASDSSAIFFPAGAITRPEACNITSCRFTGFDRTLRIDNGVSNMMVTNCVFDRCKTNAVFFNPDTVISGVRFSNCSFIAQSPPNATQIGMHLSDGTTPGTIRRVSVANCQFLRWGRNAIHMSDPNFNISITGCQFEDNSSTDTSQPVIHIAADIDHITVSNNQIYKENSALAEPNYAINIASIRDHINVTNNQVNLNHVGIAAVNNPNRGPATYRRVHNNTGQVFEGQVVTVGPWAQIDLAAGSNAPGLLMELAGTPGIGPVLLTRRGKVISIAARSSRPITSGAGSIRFQVLRDGSPMSPPFEAVSIAGTTTEIFNEDVDGHDFNIGNTLSIRYITTGLTYSGGTLGNWSVLLSVYYD